MKNLVFILLSIIIIISSGSNYNIKANSIDELKSLPEKNINTNVKINRVDYETNTPLTGAVLSLYEGIDDSGNLI